MTSETKSITLRVRAVGDKVLKNISKEMTKVAKNTKRIKRDFGGLRNVFLGVFAGRGIKAVVGMADNVQLLNDRINSFVGSADKGSDAMLTLFEAADLTNQSIDTLAEGFNRIALSTEELGLTTNEMIGFTTTLQNAFRIQGASAAEASGATIQLTQGLSSGALRGQELRSVLEASAVAADVLADGVGIARGELIKFAESGAFTSEVVLKAFSNRALELNERAGKLGSTFGQTLTKAVNRFKFGLNELNKNAKLNEKFETSIRSTVDSIEDLVKAINRSDGFERLIGFMSNYVKFTSGLASSIFGKKSPLQETIDEIKEAGSEAINLRKQINSLKNNEGIITKIFSAIRPGGRGTKRNLNDPVIEGLEKQIELIRKRQGLLRKSAKGQKLRASGGLKSDPKNENSRALKALQQFAGADFDKLLSKGAISLAKLNLEFSKQEKSGKLTTQRILDYKRAVISLEKIDIEKRFTKGNLALEKRNEELKELAERLRELNNGGFDALERGASDYIKSIKSVAEETSSAVTSAFGTLEDSLFDFVKTGKFMFNDFAQSVLDDLTKIAIRQAIVAPFADALLGSGTSNASSGNPNDASFVGPRKRFAKGGVVNRPTSFSMNSGQGLMGEAGPEAIVPLSRVSGGDLGIKAIPSNVQVNVINNAGVEVQTEESNVNGTTQIDLTITRAVNNAINQGRFDKTFSSNFNVNRKGSR